MDRTLEQAETLIAQLELKNLELQVQCLQHELTSFEHIRLYVSTRAPMVQAQLGILSQQLQDRQPKAP